MKDFIFGIYFCLIVIPILQCFSELIMGGFDYFKSCISVAITKNNCKIEKLVDENSKIPDPAPIGFQVEEEEYWDE